MDPQTGEILALANWPTFNPNAFQRVDDGDAPQPRDPGRLRAGLDVQVVTASAALERRRHRARRSIDVQPRLHHVSAAASRSTTSHHYGVLSFTDVIVKSSNVGAIKVGLRLGPERLGRYVNRFGFGQTLAPDFRGETPGIVWSAARLDASALASVSMGYQVGVTPLQMAAAVSSVANGGELLEPRVVRAFISDGRRDEVPRKVVRRDDQPRHGRDADRDHGSRSSSAAPRKRRADRRLHDRRQDRHRREARQRAATRSPTTTRRSSASCRRASRRSRSSS